MQIELLEKIEAVGGRLAKTELVGKLDPSTRTFVKLAMDPNVTFGIKADEDYWSSRPDYTDPRWSKVFWSDFEHLLDKFRFRELTGNAAQEELARVLSSAGNNVERKWACRVLNRNLRAGFDISTYNKVWKSDPIDEFKVQLADTYEAQELEGLWFFQPKLDGNRVTFYDGKAMSRSGKEYPNCEFVVEEIEARYGPGFWDEWVIDGEMMGDLGFDQSSGALRRISQKGKKQATFTYWAFDLVTRKEWDQRNTRTLFYRDLDVTKHLSGFERIKVVPTERLYGPTHKQVMELCQQHVDAGFEGAMAKQAESAYVFKRGDNVLKAKLFKDVDARIVPGSFYLGKGKNKNRLGGFYIQTADGIKSKCGGGFSDALRKEIWDNRPDWDNAVVQVQYFEKTKDGSLRFPVFIMRRKDKE